MNFLWCFLRKKPIFTRAFSTNCLLGFLVHSAWLLINAVFGSLQWSSQPAFISPKLEAAGQF